jgi:hypothetical protein
VSRGEIESEVNGHRDCRHDRRHVHIRGATIATVPPLKERAMRHEIRVRLCGLDWEVDSDQIVLVHATRAAALREANAMARVAWVVDHRCSAVKELRVDGWAIESFYGLEGLHD